MQPPKPAKKQVVDQKQQDHDQVKHELKQEMIREYQAVATNNRS
jgi:hypothetical protein